MGKFRMGRIQPRPDAREKVTSFRNAFQCHRVRNRDAEIVCLISCRAIGVKHSNTIGIDPRRLWQGLDQKLVMSWLVGRRAETVCEHRDQCCLHDRSVRGIEACIGAKPLNACVCQRPIRRREQAFDLHPGGGVPLELSDPQQVVQGHRRCP